MKFLPIHEAGGRSRWTWGCKTTLGPKNCQKTAENLAELFRGCIQQPVLQHSSDLQVKKRTHSSHKLQSSHSSQFSSIWFDRFVNSLLLFLFLNQKGARYNTLSSPFFTVIYSKLVHGPRKEKKKNICLQRTATYEDRTTNLHQRLLQHLLQHHQSSRNWVLQLRFIC